MLKYHNYLQTVARQFNSLFQAISTQYNFDKGEEFEIAVCQALRTILPAKYGICRGFAVTEDNETAGDDILIYDRDTFPTLRLLPQDSFERKEYIPIEAIYAYLEAKYTLEVHGLGPQSLTKACTQVARVKNLPRQGRPLNVIDAHLYMPYLDINRPGWPPILNPLFGAVIAQQVRIHPRKKHSDDPAEIRGALAGAKLDPTILPDLIIAGNNIVLVPAVQGERPNEAHMLSPFHESGKTALIIKQVEDIAFAIGISSLIWSLDYARLNPIPWNRVIEEGVNQLNKEYKPKK